MPAMKERLTLELLAEELAVCWLPVDAAVPGWAWAGELTSLTSTDHELSLVCSAAAVPGDIEKAAGWRAFKLRGTLDFQLVGVLAGLSGVLAEAGIPIFVISTYETDYLLVQEAKLEDAIDALRAAGYGVEAVPGF
jgi:hypothetical protein